MCVFVNVDLNSVTNLLFVKAYVCKVNQFLMLKYLFSYLFVVSVVRH